MEGKKAREKDGKVGSEHWLGLGRSCSPVLGAGSSGLQESPRRLQSQSVLVEGHVVAT